MSNAAWRKRTNQNGQFILSNCHPAARKLSSGKTMNERAVPPGTSWKTVPAGQPLVVQLCSSSRCPLFDPALCLLPSPYIYCIIVVRRLEDTLHLFSQGAGRKASRSKTLSRNCCRFACGLPAPHPPLGPRRRKPRFYCSCSAEGHLKPFGRFGIPKTAGKRYFKKYPFFHYTIETEPDEGEL